MLPAPLPAPDELDVAKTSSHTLDSEKASAERAKAILAAVRAIPRGEVRSYAEVARMAGWPRHARLVARVLADSAQKRLPWHRVLRADGRIAFPEGSPAWQEQLHRLQSEGVALVNGRVRREAACLPEQNDLDAALWGAD